MKLAIVIPSSGTRDLTLRCVRSAVSCGDEVAEIVVVDNGSRDSTAEAVAREFPGVTLLRFPEPLGFSRAANLGAERTEAPLLLFLNADAEIRNGSVQVLLQAFREDPRLGIAGGWLEQPDGAAHWFPRGFPSLSWLFALSSGLPALFSGAKRRISRLKGPSRDPLRPADGNALIGVEWVSGAAMAIRRDVWKKHGPFDEGFRFYAQDLDLCEAAGLDGWKVCLVPGFRVTHTRGSSVAQMEGSSSQRDIPELLLTDLVLWAAKRHPARFAAGARRALMAGCRLRLLGYAASRLVVRDGDTGWLSRDTAAYRRALRALGRLPVDGTRAVDQSGAAGRLRPSG